MLLLLCILWAPNLVQFFRLVRFDIERTGFITAATLKVALGEDSDAARIEAMLAVRGIARPPSPPPPWVAGCVVS